MNANNDIRDDRVWMADGYTSVTDVKKSMLMPEASSTKGLIRKIFRAATSSEGKQKTA